jgi:glucose-6-phosphate dehydrogenase assembly protein OpcA
LLQGSQVDASVGTTVRAGVVAVFNGKATTLAQLGTLVAPFDTPTIPWWQATVAQGGGGLTGTIGPADLAAAGGLT